jgi:hypothetical protein
MTKAEREAFSRRMEEKRKSIEAESKAAFVRGETARFIGMGEEEGGKAILGDERLKKDPRLLNAVISGFSSYYEMTSRQRALADKIRLKPSINALTEADELPEEERFAKVQEIMSGLAPADRTKLSSFANEVTGGNWRTDPAAVEQATDLLLSGDEVPDDVRVRIAPKDWRKLERAAQKQVLAGMKQAFEVTADEWVAVKKDMAKALGVSKADMLKSFLDRTDADEKNDFKRLKQEADNFFKEVALNKKIGKSETVPLGLLTRAADKGAAPLRGGSDEIYGRVKAWANEKGIPGDSWFGKYSDKKMAELVKKYFEAGGK